MCAQQAAMGTVLRTVLLSPFTFTRYVNCGHYRDD